MHRLSRFVALAGVLGTLVAGLAAGPVAAARADVVGHVYVNNNSAGTNTIAGFDRHADGSLDRDPGSPFAAGGAGTGAPFGSAGGLQRSTRRPLPRSPRIPAATSSRSCGSSRTAGCRSPTSSFERPHADEHRGPRHPRLRRQRRRRREQLHGLPR